MRLNPQPSTLNPKTTAPGDEVFYARYREEKSLLNWVATSTINSDPYGTKPLP